MNQKQKTLEVGEITNLGDDVLDHINVVIVNYDAVVSVEILEIDNVVPKSYMVDLSVVDQLWSTVISESDYPMVVVESDVYINHLGVVQSISIVSGDTVDVNVKSVSVKSGNTEMVIISLVTANLSEKDSIVVFHEIYVDVCEVSENVVDDLVPRLD